MNMSHGSKELLEKWWDAGVNFMHNLTYLQIVYVIHFKKVKIHMYSGFNLDLKGL